MLTSVKHAVFGKPVTHEEAMAAERADLANRRHAAVADGVRARFRNGGFLGY